MIILSGLYGNATEKPVVYSDPHDRFRLRRKHAKKEEINLTASGRAEEIFVTRKDSRFGLHRDEIELDGKLEAVSILWVDI